MLDPPPDDALRCEREPLRAPGRIQPHGVLFVLDARDLTVTHVSANVETMLGRKVDDVAGFSLARTICLRQAKRLSDAIEDGDLVQFNPIRVDIDVAGTRRAFACVVHQSAASYIIELERSDARRENSRTIFSGVRTTIARLKQAPDIGDVMRIAAREVQQLSGFDRVMVYRFGEHWNGEVVAEVTSGADILPVYMGLLFPASDIPEQARRLYLEHHIRLIADVRAVPATLVPAVNAEREPVDLSAAILRSPAPVHLEYLHNMGVRASMSISIVISGRLWGLIACHHRRPQHIGYDIRAACMLAADMLAWQLASRLEQIQATQSAAGREALASFARVLRAHDDLCTGLTAAAPDLLDPFDAQGFAVMSHDMLQRVGRTPADDGAIALIARALLSTVAEGIAASHTVGTIVPAAKAEISTASGALLITLSEGTSEYLILFRGERIRTVYWGGDKRIAVTDGAGAIHPRTSFAPWKETRRGESACWSTQDLASAQFTRQLILERSKSIEHDRAGEFSYLATHDTLTGLPNRSALQQMLQSSVHEAQRDGRILAILFVDLDNFKHCNDSYGHATGDRILQITATRIEHSLRHGDTIARLGGDEFVIISRQLTSETDAEFVAAKIIAALAQPIVIPNTPPMYLTASVGIAVFPKDGIDGALLLHNADVAMYRAKGQGRGTFAYFAADSNSPT